MKTATDRPRMHITLNAHKLGHLLFSDHYMNCMLQRVRKSVMFFDLNNYISNCAKFIQVFESGGTVLILSMRCRADPVFLGPVVSDRPRFVISTSRCKNAMPKSR